MSDYLVGLESSGWLRHIKAIVDAAIFLAKVLVLLFVFFLFYKMLLIESDVFFILSGRNLQRLKHAVIATTVRASTLTLFTSTH